MNKWLKELVDYQSGGLLIWRKRSELSRTDKTFNTKFSGNKVGSVAKTGYLETRIKGTAWLVHRLVFLFHHNYLPDNVDHINGIKTDNRIENLRSCTVAQNMHNAKGKSSKTNDLPKGVFYDRRGRYRVQISYNKKIYWGGYHSDIDEAVTSCNNLRMKLHKDFRKE